MTPSKCCSATRGSSSTACQGFVNIGPDADTCLELVEIPGGLALVGTDSPVLKADEEGPCRRKRLKPFLLMPIAVTNDMFAAFVDETGFESEAERFGWSFVFFQQSSKDQQEECLRVAEAGWWLRIEGATWRAIGGPGTEYMWHGDHPVVHVSWNDARAFANWAGGRLPSEAEWEHAARGGQGDVPFPWGRREPDDESYWPCNIWQGRFPHENTCRDGYEGTAPARSFSPNDYGLYNLVGNVWEWTSTPFRSRSISRKRRRRSGQVRGSKILKGGSFLCHKSYCYRYRIAARTTTTPDTTASHQGFRLVFDSSRKR